MQTLFDIFEVMSGQVRKYGRSIGCQSDTDYDYGLSNRESYTRLDFKVDC